MLQTDGTGYARLPAHFYTRVDPTRVAAPRLIKFNAPLAAELDLALGAASAEQLAEIFSGNALLPGSVPVATVYAGHQFGQFVPQLGDGRALLLGEACDRLRRRREIQLKGSGRTPYSRGGDGRAALGPVLREYLVSEAMHALGVSSTRALAAVATGEPVMREQGALPGAVLTRVALSHVRVGTFQYFAARGDADGVRRLADYVIERLNLGAAEANPYLGLLRSAVRRQASLVAAWMNVGFIHGVMNTDNMAVSGETIDFGPCAFLDVYDPAAVFSSIDRRGRYAYSNQPAAAQWDLARFAETLLPLIDPESGRAIELASEVIEEFAREFARHHLAGMRRKLGLCTEEADDLGLAHDFLDIMHRNHADFTLTFRRLCAAAEGPDGEAALEALFDEPMTLRDWVPRWRARLGREPQPPRERAAFMRLANPAVTPRNHRIEAAHSRRGARRLRAIRRVVAGIVAPLRRFAIRGRVWRSAAARGTRIANILRHLSRSEGGLPYWQAGDPERQPEASPLPAEVDVLVVGAGYTGLAAARETAAAGASTAVLEAGDLGAGCSGRNGGQVAYSIKPTYRALESRYGASKAYAICREGHDAVAYVRELATQEGADVDWRNRGCFFGAHTPRHFAAMVREAREQPRGHEQRISVVAKAEQRQEIASDFYHGGCVYHDDASVDPMRLLRLLDRRAQSGGALVFRRCPVRSVRPAAGGYEVMTARGRVLARKVLIATNGYSGTLSRWHRRRVIPIGSYQIATERLGKGAVNELIPQGRNVVDSRRVVVYFRPSPDGERLLFGGRAALSEKDPRVCVPRLKAMLTRIFPQLGPARVEYAWVGWVAYTFDSLPHLGRRDGIYYCMGYCGQGVPLAPYFGMRIGQQMVGSAQGRTALDDLPFPTRPYYAGEPWFLAPSVFAYRILDAAGL